VLATALLAGRISFWRGAHDPDPRSAPVPSASPPASAGRR
jgi:hypothetical protein